MRLTGAVACLLVLLTTSSCLYAVVGQDVDVFDPDDDADSSRVDEDVLQEILEIQRMELEEEEQNEVMMANDSNEASIAEKVAAEQERLNQSKRKAAHHSGKKARGPKGVRSSLKSATANSDRYHDATAGRGRAPGDGSGSSAYDNVKMSQQSSSPGGMGKMKSGEGGKMSSLADDLVSRLEASLGSDMRTKATEDMQQKEEVLSERAARYSRYRVARRHAAPVEHILITYSDARTDLYDVLRVTASSDDALIKRAYRSLALSVHPDKNPHPDAKAAFEAVQEAFDTLSTGSSSSRVEYDAQRARMARIRRLTWRRLKRSTTDALSNWYSEIQLFIHQLRQNQRPSALQSLLVALHHRLIEDSICLCEHLVLLPSFYDRWQLYHEKLWQSRRQLLVAVLLMNAFI